MMKKIVMSILCLIFPILAFASSGSSLSFAPPPGDYSVVFLGNIFGIVDGVLHGTGSQIIGNMFGVFNSAVLALGGIIIMYTLLVSTMNTAQEGQMLGQKWSSIWVPMRSTLGLALLIPKASGYCLMQIFVMWIVVQGVGAADKVWAAALSYLNRGGVIVQTQMNPATSLTAAGSEIALGASTILAGQVCMVGVQSILETQRQVYLDAKQNGSGPCSGTPSGAMQTFCTTAVPDFLNTVNVVAKQNQGQNLTPPPDKFSVSMPNFDTNSTYAALNGICGTINWNALSTSGLSGISSLSSNELKTAETSRAIAIQQMYIDLSSIAQVMVNNDPGLNPQKTNTNTGNSTQSNFSAVAIQQFGVPLLSSGKACTDVDKNCVMWGQDPSNPSAPLFSGTEFQGAIADYNGIMLPTLNLMNQAKNAQTANDSRSFIQQANQQGWILAGSYFFNLARLNSSDMANTANQTDTGTGLNSSSFSANSITDTFKDGQCTSDSANLCQWLNKDPSMLNQVISLINGSTVLPNPLSPPNVTPTGHQAIKGPGSSTAYGFVNNSVMVNLPGQPGLTPPAFAMKFNINIDFGQFQLPNVDFPCAGVTAFDCFGRALGNLFYNLILKNIFNFFFNMVAPVVNAAIMTFLSVPLAGMAQIFQNGVAIIQQPTVNPVIALANMGVNYINFANDLWILLIQFAITAALIPVVGIFIFALIALIMPLLLSWLGIMVGIGFLTSYYIPLLPYMIFTFGSIAWLMAVIEAMVAAPIVALGVTHPEGHDAFGKGEQAIMILMNVFLRPAMMIIGYIAAISLSYVSVWIINAGFANAAAFIQGTGSATQWNFSPPTQQNASQIANNMNMNAGYSGWAGIYGFFFCILIYTTMYLIVVQKAFTLITYLPDKVLRWIGGQPEGIGEQAAQWGEEAKTKVGEAGKETSKAAQQMDSQLSGYAMKGIGKMKGKSAGGKPEVTGKGGGSSPEATQSPPVE